MDNPNYVQLTTTVENKAQAEELANGLISARLAACVQIDGPITSIFRWKGEREQAEEWRLTVKTTAKLGESAQEAIAKSHPYDTPEIIIMPILGGHDDYLKWIDAETGK